MQNLNHARSINEQKNTLDALPPEGLVVSAEPKKLIGSQFEIKLNIDIINSHGVYYMTSGGRNIGQFFYRHGAKDFKAEFYGARKMSQSFADKEGAVQWILMKAAERNVVAAAMFFSCKDGR